MLAGVYGIASLNLSKGRHEASRFFGNLIKVWWDEVFSFHSLISHDDLAVSH